MKRKYWILLVVFVFIFLIDQWTKFLVQQKLFLYQSVEIIPGFFNLIHVRNTGGAFGVLGGERGGLGSFLFVTVSVIAVAAILYLFTRLKDVDRNLSLSFSLVLSGALGNLSDRLRHGEVIDFLDFHLGSYHWPAFNIADTAICIGIGLMVLELWARDRKRNSKSHSPAKNR